MAWPQVSPTPVMCGMRVHRFKEVCRGWGALKRQRQLVHSLAGRMSHSVPKMARVVEIGLGKGELGWFERQGLINVVTVDIGPCVGMVVMDIALMALREVVFSVSVLAHVLDHAGGFAGHRGNVASSQTWRCTLGSGWPTENC